MPAKAKNYSKEKYILAVIELIYSLVLLVFFQFFGASDFVAFVIKEITSNNYLAIACYALLITIAYAALSFPINLYRTFILEHNFNLSTQNIKNWFSDFLKSFAIFVIIFIILVEVFYFILNKFTDTWWLVTAGFWIFFSIILARLTPTIIIPLFFKYKPLSDEVLKGRILKLADKMRVRILDVFQIDFSKKTVKANAAFVGVGNTKRVILADTLKDKYTHDEIEVILAHEFAHYRAKHLLKLIFMNAAFTLLLLYLIFVSSRHVLEIFGLGQLNDIANLPVLLLYAFIFNIITTPFGNAISRKFERDADRLAIKFTGSKEAFISVMEKLGKQNLADTNPGKLIKWFFFDHPPISERIKAADRP